MSQAFITILIMSAVSGVLQGLGAFVPRLTRVCAALLLAWHAAALPILYFMNVPSREVLLFYILSALLGLIFNLGGKPA